MFDRASRLLLENVEEGKSAIGRRSVGYGKVVAEIVARQEERDIVELRRDV